MIDYQIYWNHADDYQREILKLLKTKTKTQTAADLGVSTRTVERHLKKLRETAALAGFDPEVDMTYKAPSGFQVSTVRVNNNGEYFPSFRPKKQDSIEDILEAFAKPIKAVPKIKEPNTKASEFLNLYTISDYHLGMLAWDKESGEDWDLNIASDVLEKSFLQVIERSQDADECFINILGDFFHIDSMLPVTPTSKHVLDADTRYYKLIDTGVQLLRSMISSSLKKHKKVSVLVAEGNHDESTAPLVQILLAAVYEKNPRVNIIKSPKTFYHYVFGNVMLCFHHGHKRHKPSDLNKVFSSDPMFRGDWGKCKYAYGHTGHMHHERVDDGGCLWTQHPTLAARDAYASRLGYSAMRGCISFTYHKDYGEYSSFYVRPEVLT